MIELIIFFVCLLFLVFFKIVNILNNQKDNFEVIEIKESNLNNHDNRKKKIKNKKPIKSNNLDNILLKCFDGKKIFQFDKKYGKYKKTIVYKDSADNIIKGVVNITPTKYISELPQITLNGYFINNLCVDPDHRRKGIAEKLMKYIISRAKKEDKLHLMLQVEKGGKSQSYYDFLVNFYLGLGFLQYDKYDGTEILIHKL